MTKLYYSLQGLYAFEKWGSLYLSYICLLDLSPQFQMQIQDPHYSNCECSTLVLSLSRVHNTGEKNKE